MGRGIGHPKPSREERIARVVHDALRAWREVTAGRKLPDWYRSPKHRALATELVDHVLAGATPESVHALRLEAGAATAPWAEAPEAERKESALVHAVASTLGCGVERWDVKTGKDAASASVNLTARPATVAELIAFPAPPPDPPARVAGEPECQVYTIEATITACKIEADSDYHLALVDDQGNTMIAEAVCPGCAAGSPWLPQITAVRAAVQAAIPGITEEYQDVGRRATISGPGFFDRIHGQRGVAGNGIEIHPVLDIEFGTDPGGSA